MLLYLLVGLVVNFLLFLIFFWVFGVFIRKLVKVKFMWGLLFVLMVVGKVLFNVWNVLLKWMIVMFFSLIWFVGLFIVVIISF